MAFILCNNLNSVFLNFKDKGERARQVKARATTACVAVGSPFS